MNTHITPSENDWFGPDYATFGDRLSSAREAVDMTQATLARRLGVKLATLKSWEEDRSEPRANRLQMLSGLLGVSLSWLINGQGEGPSANSEAGFQSPSVAELMQDIRSVKVDMSATTEKLAKLEKRLAQILMHETK